jgi:hypothetical protein
MQRYGRHDEAAAKAIEKARELRAEDKDAVAVAVLSMTEETPIVAIDEETRAAIREGLVQARRGEFRAG